MLTKHPTSDKVSVAFLRRGSYSLAANTICSTATQRTKPPHSWLLSLNEAYRPAYWYALSAALRCKCRWIHIDRRRPKGISALVDKDLSIVQTAQLVLSVEQDSSGVDLSQQLLIICKSLHLLFRLQGIAPPAIAPVPPAPEDGGFGPFRKSLRSRFIAGTRVDRANQGVAHTLKISRSGSNALVIA